MKILLAIANHGTKNSKYLNRLLAEYRSIGKYKVDIVVISNIPKDLGSDVEVLVGLPAKNPWSLPFGHKKLFADRMEDYDLFIYSEDDTLITERSIDAFIEVTRILPKEFIAGFIRYEISESGNKYYSTIHAHYHWDPNSVLQIGKYIFAHYTNDHSACFILTKGQLKRAIHSGGFLLPPRIGRYDMLVTAATDPYTQCGMKKLVCISRLDEFCLHHLPNVYCGKIGIDAGMADREIEKLKALSGTDTDRAPLFETSTLLEDASWDKRYYEPARKDILSLMPTGVKRVLSVGCGCGSTESELIKQGMEVAGIPLDCVIQVTAESKGIRILPPNFTAAIGALRGERFDCILFPDVLQHLPDPISLVRDFINLLKENGCMILSVPNSNHPSVVRQRMHGKLRFPKGTGKYAYEKYKLHFTTRRILRSWLERSGLEVIRYSQHLEPRLKRWNRIAFGIPIGILSRNVVLLCKRNSPESMKKSSCVQV
jgi:2-polyprenyl-3-methyl-5-hydroxy-6-metoxy-1,4-benzoquinol methylase